ncbi:MAG: TetR/AcrR family transcriptional regulator [Burkholderiales bacterium]|nr:TetR/AcrR family transcriptional regulator [Burkholderiales bacterium]MBH2014883.1 TetR/AcrR family transcriptional regulator [Burkholderiales bacterium]
MPRSAKPASPAAPPPKARGKVGRPPKTYVETEELRTRIKAATAKVFADRGYHGLAVEAIVQEAALSRPTFYRYFSNVDEVLGVVLSEVNDRLVHDVQLAVRGAADPMAKVEAGLLAWRRWGEWVGPMLASIYAEMHQTSSPAYHHRMGVIELISKEVDAAYAQLGRGRISRVLVETFVVGVEHLGYRYHLGEQGRSEEAWREIRSAMLRLAIGLLGARAEWSVAPQLAEQLDIRLD